jgi:hypothetical protein
VRRVCEGVNGEVESEGLKSIEELLLRLLGLSTTKEPLLRLLLSGVFRSEADVLEDL